MICCIYSCLVSVNISLLFPQLPCSSYASPSSSVPNSIWPSGMVQLSIQRSSSINSPDRVSFTLAPPTCPSPSSSVLTLILYNMWTLGKEKLTSLWLKHRIIFFSEVLSQFTGLVMQFLPVKSSKTADIINWFLNFGIRNFTC